MRLACIALLTACGRIAFDPAGGGTGDGRNDVGGAGDGGGDAIVLPMGFCSASTQVGANSNGDLAVARTHDGFLAIWGSAVGPRRVHGDAALAFDAAADLPVLGSALDINALLDEGSEYLVSTNDASATPSWWSLNFDFSQQSLASETSAQPVAKDSMVTNVARNTFVYADENGTTVSTRYFFGNAFGAATNFTAAATVVAVAGADGPDHAHLAWTTAPDASTRSCYTGHIMFNATPVLMNVTQAVATGCGSQLRAASGAATDDAIAIAWTDSAGMVHARYKVQQWELGAGDGARIKFDGTNFWAAWTAQGTGVHVAKLVAGGTFTDYPLPGLAPASLESLELLVDGTTVYVVSLESSQLVFAWRC